MENWLLMYVCGLRYMLYATNFYLLTCVLGTQVKKTCNPYLDIEKKVP